MMARLYVIAWLFVLAATLLSPAVLFAVLVWPTWRLGWWAGWELAGWRMAHDWRWVA